MIKNDGFWWIALSEKVNSPLCLACCFSNVPNFFYGLNIGGAMAPIPQKELWLKCEFLKNLNSQSVTKQSRCLIVVKSSKSSSF